MKIIVCALVTYDLFPYFIVVGPGQLNPDGTVSCPDGTTWRPVLVLHPETAEKVRKGLADLKSEHSEAQQELGKRFKGKVADLFGRLGVKPSLRGNV